MEAFISNPAKIVFIGSAIALIGSLIAAYGGYLGAIQNQESTEHLLSSVTGGNSYPQIILAGDGEFSLAIVGDYPLHEVHGKVVDVNALREHQKQSNWWDNPVPNTQYFEVGTMSSAYAIHLVNRFTGKPIRINQF